MENDKKIGFNPTAGGIFFFAGNCLIFFCILKGLFPGDARLIAGICALTGLPFFILAAKEHGSQGNSYLANIFILFGGLFCGEFALNYLLGYFGSIYGWTFDSTVLVVPLLISAVLMLPTMIPGRFLPVVPFLIWLFIYCWLPIIALLYILPNSLFLYYLNIWMALISGCGATYLALVEMMSTVGVKMPQGKPLFKPHQTIKETARNL